jgi:radical SAM protein with 4Fe4S-binding SPASM domain
MGIKYAISTESLIPRTDGNKSPLIQILTDQQYERLVATQNIGIGSGRSQACKPGHIRGAITPDGNVSPCEWLTDFKLGNLREKSLREIWYGDQFLSFRNVFQQESECPSCSLKPGCRRCPAHSYLETGNLLSCAPIQRHNAEIFQATHSGVS